MNQLWQLGIILSCMGVMIILFLIVFTMVVRYLISVFKLIYQVKTAEYELWVSLGSPTMFPLFHISFNPFKGLISQMRFFNWFLKGAEGAKEPETKAMVEKTRRLYRIAGIGLISVFAIFLLFFGVMWLVIGMKGTA